MTQKYIILFYNADKEFYFIFTQKKSSLPQEFSPSVTDEFLQRFSLVTLKAVFSYIFYLFCGAEVLKNTFFILNDQCHLRIFTGIVIFITCMKLLKYSSYFLGIFLIHNYSLFHSVTASRLLFTPEIHLTFLFFKFLMVSVLPLCSFLNETLVRASV